jgi:hypothetical protein
MRPPVLDTAQKIVHAEVAPDTTSQKSHRQPATYKYPTSIKEPTEALIKQAEAGYIKELKAASPSQPEAWYEKQAYSQPFIQEAYSNLLRSEHTGETIKVVTTPTEKPNLRQTQEKPVTPDELLYLFQSSGHRDSNERLLALKKDFISSHPSLVKWLKDEQGLSLDEAAKRGIDKKTLAEFVEKTFIEDNLGRPADVPKQVPTTKPLPEVFNDIKLGKPVIKEEIAANFAQLNKKEIEAHLRTLDQEHINKIGEVYNCA